MLARSLRFGFGGLFVCFGLGFGCQTNPDGSLSVVEQAITGTCQISQLGMPCDPDGAAGPLQECEGICLLQPPTGPIGGVPSVSCVAITKAGVTSMDGRLCGSTDSSNCGQVCAGKFCVAKSAVAGTACRPAGGFTNTVCDGQCNGTGTCVALADTEKCKIERLTAGGFNQDCVWDFCSPTAAKTCQQYAIPKGITCNDSSACTSGDTCDGTGKCTGTAKVCPATGDPCLENKCVASSGACVASPTTAACTYTADKCFAGVCAGGTCGKGAAIDCDDKNPCTDDGCDATTGCKHTPKACPPPSDACTVATCDPTSGGCGFVAKSCDDGDACTADSCDKTTGCKHTPIAGCTPTDAGTDTGPADTGVIDTGVIVDTGIGPDTGVGPDTGIAPDTGSTPDTGTVEDTGSSGDTGSATDGSATDGGATDGGATDGGDDAGDVAPEDLSRGGCGCRTPNSAPTSTGAFAALGLAALLVGRRRR